MNILFLATYGDFLATFEYSNITLWQELGCTVHCASNFSSQAYNLKTERLDKIGVVRHELVFERSPFKKRNLIAYKQLVQLIKKEEIAVIDCHNAIVSVFARLAAARCGIKKVIYTPHSFFFYKGCPKKNKLIYKNVEAFMARKTDLLISINKEDYDATLKFKVRGKALYVPGVGIDTTAIINLPNQREKYCTEFDIPKDALIFVSVGELIHRKNHTTAIKAFAKADIPNSYYLICGIGELTNEVKQLIAKLGLKDRVKLLGYRLDAKEIMKASDVYVFPSFQEGLPVALMEAMACGLFCIASRIRGNVDLIDEGKGGYFFEPTDIDTLSQQMNEVASKFNDLKEWGRHNQKCVKEFDINNVRSIMKKEYSRFLG